MRKVAKQIISAVLFAGMVSSMYVPVLAQEDFAKLEFNASGVTYSNIDWVAYNNGSITEIGGRPALQLKAHDNSNLYLRVALADRWLYAPEGTAAEFDVEYYDTGTGSFAIAYDSTHNNDVGSKDTEMVQMTGDNKWKKATLYVDDIRAVNSFEGGDFRLGLWSETMDFSDDDIYIGSIEVRKVFPKHPIEITITTPYYGNIFGGQEDRTLDVNFTDLTDERMNTEVSYIVTDENGQTVKTGMIAENPYVVSETVKLDLNDITKFGLYDIAITAVSNIELNGETKQFTSTASTKFSIINKSEIGETNWRNGVCTHSGTGWWPVDGTAEIARWAGFGSVRDEIFWSNIETQKGQYVMTEQGQQYIDKLRENGLKLLYISLGNNPLYYAEGGDFVHTSIPTNDEGIKAHAKFCAWMTKEYNDVLTGVEIWNEPNTPASNYFMVDGAAYTKLLREAYKEIKAVDPNMPVLAPGCEPEYSDWANQTFPAKSYEVTDVFVAHAYNWKTNKFVPEDYVARFDNVKAFDEKYGVLDKPRWFTEFGFTTGEAGKVFEGSEREQLQTAIREYVTGVAENLFERTYWYDLISDGNYKENVEHNFGLVKNYKDFTLPYAAKPAYVAMAGMNKFLADAEYVDKIYVNKEYYAFRFKKNGEDIAVLWANRGNEQSVSFNFGTDSVEMFDKYTNSEGKLIGKDGVFSFALGEDPIYIKGNFSKFEKAGA